MYKKYKLNSTDADDQPEMPRQAGCSALGLALDHVVDTAMGIAPPTSKIELTLPESTNPVAEQAITKDECMDHDGAPINHAEETGRSPRSGKSYKSAVIIMPPKDCWPQIQAIREEHDKSFVRWMPHINLLYPFLADTDDVFQKAAESFTSILSEIQPFQIQFTKSSFKYFIHKKSCTLWLKPLTDKGDIQDSDGGDRGDGDGSMKDQQSGSATQASGVSDPVCEPTEVNSRASTKDGSDWSRDDRASEPGEEDMISSQLHCATLSPGAGQSHDKAESHNMVQSLESDDNHDMAGLPFGGCEEPPGQKRKKGSKLSKAEKKAQKKKQRPELPDYGRSHPEVLLLQKSLLDAYPNCDDISVISERGFMPHLSLGQFTSKEVEQFQTAFSKDWTDVSFVVDEVYLISRDNFDDPFHVRYAVPLGKGMPR